MGNMTLKSLIKGRYERRIYPVNPKADTIFGLKSYPSISDIPDNLDAVVIVIPAAFVAAALGDAAQKGARGAIIQAAGFREAGRPDLEEEIITVAREVGIRLIGPNVQGIHYLANKFCPMFFPVIDLKGPLAVITQSGTITAALAEWAAREGLGISAMVNLGNQADICEADLIEYFVQDPHSKAIIMYLESVKNGPRFLEALSMAALNKPVVIFKAGRTVGGAISAASHTGAMASNHNVFSAVCRQFGAVIAPDLETLYDQAKGLATIKPPRGRRLLVISTSGGAGTVAVDEAESLGLTLAEIPPEMVQELIKLELSPLVKIQNPLDLASITAEHFRKVALLADNFNTADVILISFGDPVRGGSEVIQELAKVLNSSLAASYFGGGEMEIRDRFLIQRAGIPVFASPDRAVRGIAAAVWKAEFCRTRGGG
jgi:acyl-CoA synthetase (NDP forming)